MTPKAAYLTLTELKRNQNTGTAPFTLAEKRALENAERQAVQVKETEQKIQNVSFGEYFENTYLKRQNDKKPKTVYQEALYFKNWMKPVIGNLPIRDLSSFHLQKIKSAMSKGGCVESSIVRMFAVLKHVWNTAKDDGIAIGNFPKIEFKKFDNQKKRYLTENEVDILLQSLKQLKNQTSYRMAVLSLDAGCRFGELASLKWMDVDIDREQFLLRHTKSAMNRFCYMTGRVKSIFQEMPKGEPGELVFPASRGGKLREIPLDFVGVVKKIGLNDGITDPLMKATFHNLRHTYASRLCESGIELYRVSKAIGHSSITITERYSHVREDSIRDAVKQMENRFKPGNDCNVKPFIKKAA